MRRSALSISTALLTAAGSLALPVTTASAAATTCTAPVLRETMVSQGLPSYGALVSGKSALVKLFLSLPSTDLCKAAGTQSVVITSGRLTVTGAAGVVTTVSSMVTPVSTTGAQLAAYTSAPVDNLPGDPVFAVPGNALAGSSAFTATFSALLSYTVYDSRGAVVTTGSTTAPATPLSRSVAAPGRPLRVLVVPMGDTASTTVQFPDESSRAITSGMQALSRQMPVADGVNDLADTAAAGVKFHVGSGMLNLGLHDETTTTGGTVQRNYMSTGVFCGGGNSFPYISEQLAQFLQAWNAENPAAPADRVMGAVSSTVSAGPSTGQGNTCAEGYAGIATPEAWVRAVPPAADGSRQGISGGLATLELMHTYGGSTLSSTYHSPNTSADLTAPGRAYNVTTRSQLPSTSNRSTMRFGLAPWDDYTTLFEPTDFDFEACVLSGSSSCGGAGATAGSVAAGGSFVLGGSTDGTHGGTDADTYFEPDQPQDGSDPASSYRLLQLDAGGNLLPGGNTGVRMTTEYSEHHDAADGDPSDPVTRLTFDVAIPALPASPPSTTRGQAQRIELWKGSPGTSGATRLYSADLQATAPAVTSLTSQLSATTAAQYTTGATGRQAAVSGAGDYVAWTSPTGIRVARSTSSSPASDPVAGEQVAWRPDGAQIAFLRSGSLYTAAVSTASNPPTVGTPTLVFDAGGLLGSPFDGVSYAPSGTKVVVGYGGDLWTVDLTSPLVPLSSVTCGLSAVIPAGALPPCARVTATSDTESQPSWSADDVIAYTRTPSSGPSQVWTVPASSTTAVQRIADGTSTTDPAWAGDQLLVTRPGGIVGYDTATFTKASPVTTTAGDTGAHSSTSGGTVVFDRASGSGRDVWRTTLTKRTALVTATGPGADRFVLDLFVQCGSSTEPVSVNNKPKPAPAPGATTATFAATYDPSVACPDGVLVARVTNGYQATRSVGSAVPGGGTSHVAIYSPTNGQVITQFQSLAVAGGATTASGQASNAVSYVLQGGAAGSYYATSRTVGSGGVAFTLLPQPGGWSPGSYTLSAQFTGSPDAVAIATFTVKPDPDGDGLTKEDWPCFPAGSATTPNGSADYDGDYVPNAVDPDPCVSAFNATVKFQSDSVNLASSGNYVTVTFSTAALDLSALANNAGTITRIGGYRTSMPSVSVGGLSAGSASIKFDRQALQAFYVAKDLHGFVPIVISVTTPAGSALGADPSAPTYP
jgi:hypothetical protein